MRHIRRQQENRDEFSRKTQRENEIGKKYSEDHAGKRETTESTLTPEKKRGYEEEIITDKKYVCDNLEAGKEERYTSGKKQYGKKQYGKKQNTRQIGTAYEQLAADYLKAQGYEILEHNFRCGLGEIDLIARDGNYLVFVEVKYRSRSDCGYPSDAVNYKKQVRISNGAAYYLWKNYDSDQIWVRFDVVSIQGETVQLYKDAFPYCGQFF